MTSSSSNGVGGSRSSGPIVIPGRSRTVSSSESRRPAEVSARDDEAPDARPERQWINIDGRSFDMSAPRGTYVNILV